MTVQVENQKKEVKNIQDYCLAQFRQKREEVIRLKPRSRIMYGNFGIKKSVFIEKFSTNQEILFPQDKIGGIEYVIIPTH